MEEVRRSKVKSRRATTKNQLINPDDIPVLAKERAERHIPAPIVAVEECGVDGSLSGEVVRGVELTPDYIRAVVQELFA